MDDGWGGTAAHVLPCFQLFPRVFPGFVTQAEYFSAMPMDVHPER